ncbi:YwiC-like family protein [Bifidobacterium xylocopae]|nr:YwiC-like family protein [Bifidobacterium xylocopae]
MAYARGLSARGRHLIRLWLPTQPGAWAMALLPALGGLVLNGPSWRAILLLLAWILCYCAQFAISRWFFSRRAVRYQAPAAAYGGLTIAAGLALLACAPGLLRWVPAYLILGSLSFLAAHHHQERSLWGNATAVLAACGICPIAASLGGSPVAGPTLEHGWGGYWACRTNPGVNCFADGFFPREALGSAQAATLIFAIGEFGSVLFVKTMIRERGSRGYYLLSVAWSLILPAFMALAVPVLGVWPLLLAFAPTLRAALVPPLAPPRLPVKYVGLIEFASSAAVFALALAAGSVLELPL